MKTNCFLNNLGFMKHTQLIPNKFTDGEIDVVKKIWRDLSDKSKQNEIGISNGIDEDIFNTFTNIDGLIGLRLFKTFDSKSNGYIDLEDFITGLEILCFNSIEEQTNFLFKLFDINNNFKIEKDFMNIIINSIPHDFMCKFTQKDKDNDIETNTKSTDKINFKVNQIDNDKINIDTNQTDNDTNQTDNDTNQTDNDTNYINNQNIGFDINSNYELWTNNYICINAFNEFDTNHHEYLDFNEFEKWVKSNNIVISYLKSKINFYPQSENKRKQSISKTDILPITYDSLTNRYESYMWKRCKKTNMKIKRYFLLYGSCLYYYKFKSDLKPLGVIFLSGSIISPIKDNFLSIVELNVCTGEHHPHQKRLLECETNQIRNEWISKLQKASHIVPFESIYMLREKIGDGAFSSVYKCERIEDKKIFAVKIISKENLDQNSKTNLKNEISILKLVSHPNIIHMDGFFETQDKIFFVIEFIEDGDLFNNIINRNTFDVYELKKLAKTIAECLAYLHELGIVHRDIKPENILCDKQSDRLVLTDFGFAHILLPNSKLVDTCGTLDYVAPEIINSQGYGCETDIWSLGIILYLVYYGKLPFCSDTDTTTAVNILNQEININIKKNMLANDLIFKCLNKNPKKRISAKEILTHPFITKNLDQMS